ncbi:MAG: hypothetical protein OK454_09715 [Thaumarchaeota archaeon]|nr:hypothetical protein [Nitrososphaerota archaeon]
MLGMERAVVLEKLRLSRPELPADFKPADKTQTEIITSLLTHNPKERPSSSELLTSGKLPLQMEREVVRHVLADAVDPKSPHYEAMLAGLFSRRVDQA